MIEYIYFIVAVENGGSESRNVQPMNKGLPEPWPYFPASLLYFLLLNSSSGKIFVYLSILIWCRFWFEHFSFFNVIQPKFPYSMFHLRASFHWSHFVSNRPPPCWSDRGAQGCFLVLSKPGYCYSARQCVQYPLSRLGEVSEGRGSPAPCNPSLCSWGNFIFHEIFYCPFNFEVVYIYFSFF